MNTNIAMYFSGRITAYEKNINEILELKKKYTITFFCSLNIPEITEYEQAFFNLLDMTPEQYSFESVVTPAYIYKLDSKGEAVVYERVYSQFYNNKKCMDLINKYEDAHAIKFDIIIKYRADIRSTSPLPLTMPLKNTIYIPSGKDYGKPGINDQIAYGHSDVMNIYSNACEKLEHYCNKENTLFHPETLTLKHIVSNTIHIQRFDFLYDLDPSRGPGLKH